MSPFQVTETPLLQATVPRAPPDFTATVGNTKIVLGWKTPSNGGSPITSYEYRVSRDGGTSWNPNWQSVSGSGAGTRSHTVTGLTNGVSYTFEIRAVNRQGVGDPVRTTAIPRAVPEAPGSFQATVGDGQVTLNWQTPSNGQSPITSYEYRVSRSGGRSWTPDWTTVSGGSETQSHEVTGLINGRQYVFEVRAVNGQGGGPSARVTAIPASVPETPGNFVAASVGSRVTLRWETPFNGGRPITSYEYRVSRDGGTSWSPDWRIVSGSHAGTVNFTLNLSTGVSYTFELRAVNRVGKGSVARAQIRPASRPGSPGNLTAAAGYTHINFNWRAPSSDGGSPITHYRYRIRRIDSDTWTPDWTTVSGGTEARTQSVTDLSVGVTYVFHLQAVNQVGESPSAIVRGVTLMPSTSLGSPRNFRVSPGDTQATLSWQSPLSDGGSPITHYRYRVRKTDTNTWSPDWTTVTGGAGARSQTVTSLTNDVGYTFEVQAVNGDGEGPSVSVTGTPVSPTAPDAPRSFRATAGDTQVTLRWQPPSSDGGSSITHYRYRVRKTDTNTWSTDWTTVTGGGSARSRVVTGLTNDVEYTFEVQAVNGEGEGPGARVTATPVSGATAPGVPRSFRATAGNTQVTLNWEPPSSDGGSSITHYRYRVRRTDTNTWSTDWTTVTGGGSARSRVVTGLTNGVDYTFELKAVNGVGDSSSVSATATPAICTGAVDGTLSGSGTSSDPYIVCSSNHLGLIGSNSTYGLNDHYKMGQDIDLDNVAFIPIGIFGGTFDGDGKKIKNLSISAGATGTILDVGLFKGTSLGTIKNLGIENFNITASAGAHTILAIGVLVGDANGGTISNCYAVDSDDQEDVTVTSSSASNKSYDVGGLVGSNGATIISSYVAGNVTGGDGGDQIGGLVGINTGTITSSYVTGDVTGGDRNDYIGGLAGANSGIIISSYVTGNVTGEDGSDSGIGGLVGINTGTIISSYVTGDVTGGDGSDRIGGLVGYTLSGTIISSYATGTVNGGDGNEDLAGGLVGEGNSGVDIIASYATGTVDGGAGTGDYAGSLVGETSPTVTASYGFGSTSNGTDRNIGTSLPGSVTAASGLTSSNAGDSWDSDAWDFGTTSQAPALKYVDGYGDHDDDDETDDTYTCTSTTAFLPSISITCGTTLIPGQR